MQKFTTKMLFSIILGIILISISYLYIDKPVALWIYNHHLNQQYIFLKYFIYMVDLLDVLAFLFYFWIAVKFCVNKLNTNDHILLMFANSIVIAGFLKDQFKIVFGRYWPLTWMHNNPSLIHDNAYGFNFFHIGSWYQSFPSGHTTLTFAAMSVIWYLFPRWRWLPSLIASLVVVGLLGMDYHFVSDIISGALLGTLVGIFVVKISIQNKYSRNN